MTTFKKPEDVTHQILMNISDESFMIHHSADMDLLDVYLILQSALEFIEEQAQDIAKHEGAYLQ